MLVVGAFIGIHLHAQESSANFEQFGLREGLSQSTVNDILQDSFGFLWLATDDGLNQYDGHVFRVWQRNATSLNGLKSGNVRCLLEGDDGVLWIGTSVGLTNYNRYSNSFETYIHQPGKELSLSDNEITALALADEHHLWVGTRNGLNLLNVEKGTFKVFQHHLPGDGSLTNSVVQALVTDQQGRLWCGTAAGLNLFDPSDSTFLPFVHRYDDSSSISGTSVTALDVDAWGNLWVGTGSGLCKVSPELEVLRLLEEKVPEQQGFRGAVRSLHCTSDHLVWIGTDNELLCISDEGDLLYTYNAQSQMGGGRIRSLHADHSGSLWIGSSTGGVFRYMARRQHFKEMKIPGSGALGDVGSNGVRSIAALNDTTWLIGTQTGLYEWSGEDIFEWIPSVNSKTKEIEAPTNVRALVRANDLLYVASHGDGLWCWDISREQWMRYVVSPGDSLSLTSNKVTRLFKDQRGLWIGTAGGGLLYLDNDTRQIRNWKFGGDRNKSLLGQHVTALALGPDSLLWVGTANRGLSMFNPASDEFTHLDAGAEPGYGFESHSIHCIHKDKNGDMWLGTEGGGLWKYSASSKSFKSFTSTQTEVPNSIYAIAEDEHGIFWLTARKGVYRLDIESLDLRRFDEADGLVQREFYPGAAGALPDSRIWLGSRQGMTVFNPRRYEVETTVPDVLFTEVLYTETQNHLEVEQRFFPRKDQMVELSSDVSTVALEFNLMNLVHASKSSYEYRIVETMERWASLGNRRKLVLGNLPTGLYTIQVRGYNHDGIAGKGYAELKLFIQPAYWQTWWFRTLILLLAVLAFVAFYNYRIRLVRERNVQLEKLVQKRTKEIARERDEKGVLLKEIHHRVKNNLQIISSLLSLQSRFTEDPGAEHLFTESVNRVRSMSMIHEKLYRTDNLREINLKQYLRELLETLVEAYQLDIQITSEVEVEDGIEGFTIDTLTPLGLILNELITNSLKYAFKGRSSGKISLHIKRGEAGDYHLFIADDGAGFENSDVREGSFGTELAQDLSEQLKGTLKKLPTEVGTTYHLVFQEIGSH